MPKKVSPKSKEGGISRENSNESLSFIQDLKKSGRRESLVENILKRKSVADELAAEFEIWKLEQFGALEKAAYRVPIEEYRSTLHHVVSITVNSSYFDSFIMFTIFMNAVTIAIETGNLSEAANTYKVLDTIYLTIYSMEFILKVYDAPREYWVNRYNRFDVLILATSYFSVIQESSGDTSVDVTFLRVFRALRALRALRSISFIRALQMIVNALLKTMASIVNLVTLLLLIMFVFAMIGYNYYGRGVNADEEHWGDLGRAMYTLWVFTTLDGWVALQEELDKRGFTSSRVFTILFIFIGNFIFTNLFIGVVIQNLEEAQEEERVVQEVKKTKLFRQKKKYILEKQRMDLEQLVYGKMMQGNTLSFDDFLKTIVGELRHDELTRVSYLMCNQTWLDTYLATVHVQENYINRSQRLHFEIANLLGHAVEKRLRGSIEHPNVDHQ